MVNLDPSKDYYAELELPSTCSTADVKKQYHKLALQWHPDRNPGREAEASERFQNIGAAWEVLADPELRRKYDVSRKLPNTSAPRPAGAGRRGNPYSAAAETQWDPPPRRGDPRYSRPPPPQPPRPGNAGPSKYKDFNAPPPPNSSAQDTKAYADRFGAAWSAMREGSAPTRRKGPVPPPPTYGRPGAATPEDSGRSRPPHSRQPSSRPPRSGYDATSPDGEHPPSPGASAYANRYSRSNTPRADAPGPPPNLPPRGAPPPDFRRSATAGSAMPDRRPSGVDEAGYRAESPRLHTPNRSRSGDEVPFSEGNRERTPYSAGAKGEKTFFDREALRRSASVRDAPSMVSPNTKQRRRSLNSDRRHARPVRAQHFYSSGSDESEGSGGRSPQRPSVNGNGNGNRVADEHSMPPPPRPQRPPANTSYAADPRMPPPGATPVSPMPPQTNGQSHSPGDAMEIDDPPYTKTSEGPNISMNDFRNVHPFSTSGTGIDNMSDLQTNLPFTSRASSSHPLRMPEEADPHNAPAILKTLNPPTPPVAPTTPSQELWVKYLEGMGEYMHAYNTFQARAISYFQDKAVVNAERERGPPGGMVSGWLGAVGETETLGGWETYAASLEEDELVRSRWNVACERHVVVCQRHTEARRQVLEGGLK